MWYAIEMEPDDNGAILVTVPAFPEAATYADTAAEAPVFAAAVIEEAIAARMAGSEDIPFPLAEPEELSAELNGLAYLKVMLYMLCKGQGVTRAELSRRLNWKREQVDRLFRLEHTSQLDQLDKAFKAIGCPLHYEDMVKAA